MFCIMSKLFKNISNSSSINPVSIFLEKVVKILFSLCFAIVISRFAGVGIFGIFSGALALIIITNTLSGVGIRGILVKEFVNNFDASKVFSNALITRLSISFLFIILIIPYGFYFIGLEIIDTLIAAIIVLCSHIEISDLYFQSQRKMHKVLIYRIFGCTMGLLGKIYVSINYPDITFLLLAHLFEMIFTLIFILIYLFKEKIKIHFSKIQLSLCKKLIKSGLPFLISGAATIIYMKIDQPMILRLLDENALGIYSSAIRICEGLYILSQPIIINFFPKLINYYKSDIIHFNNLMKKILLSLLLLGGIVCLVMNFIAEHLIMLFFGIEFIMASDVLCVFTLSLPIIYFRNLFSRWVIVSGYYSLEVWSQVIGVALNILLNILMIPRFGIIGAACASVLAHYLGFSIFLLFSKKARTFFEIYN